MGEVNFCGPWLKQTWVTPWAAIAVMYIDAAFVGKPTTLILLPFSMHVRVAFIARSKSVNIIAVGMSSSKVIHGTGHDRRPHWTKNNVGNAAT